MEESNRSQADNAHRESAPAQKEQLKRVVFPSSGEAIRSGATGVSYLIGQQIGEGNFGAVFSCTDSWNNDLAAKVLKATGPYEIVQQKASDEIAKLVALRHPYITYVFDAFEYRDTFYIITERCYCPLHEFFRPGIFPQGFFGQVWLGPVARCASVVTSKPANGGHSKTGQRKSPGRIMLYRFSGGRASRLRRLRSTDGT